LFAVQTAGTGIAINEIYASGPSGGGVYIYDQFIELYNYSGEMKYLDGMIMCRYSMSSPPKRGRQRRGKRRRY
ncbi:MAG TPA: hypothetical protein VHO28_07945, partial [Ignavibacteriales bacterium]|nr:hypothetical protein [Ignavibacteriales bacterium]